MYVMYVYDDPSALINSDTPSFDVADGEMNIQEVESVRVAYRLQAINSIILYCKICTKILTSTMKG